MEKFHLPKLLLNHVLNNLFFNPLSPNIHQQILQTDLYTFL